MAPMLLTLVGSLGLAVPASFLQPVASQGDDALTGIWEGRATGSSSIIPAEGIAFSLRLEARAEEQPLATFTMEGVPSTAPVEASYDVDNGEVVFRCNLTGVLIDIELELDGEELSGKATGLGITAALSGKRTTRELPVLAQPAAPRAPVDLDTLGPEAWREDLAYLAEAMPRLHANAFHTLSKEEWQRRVQALDARLPELSPAAAGVALCQLVAAVGDAHTDLFLFSAPPFTRYFPLQITWFADGLFVTAVDERFEPALGGRVKRLGKLGIDEVIAAVRTTFASENESWPRYKAPGRLAQPDLLAALGIIADTSSIPLVVEGPGGEDVAVTIDGSGSGKWLVAPDRELVPVPLWLQRLQETYWFAPTPDGRALYCAYNRCAEDPEKPMKDFIAELRAALELPGVERLVIDLRHNTGGNSNVLGVFVPELGAHPRLAAPGALCALIGPKTFSSGMRNAYELRTQAHARLLGEPTGGKPNAYGEVRYFQLPRSGLRGQYSSVAFHDMGPDGPAIEPDVLVAPTSADWFAGADPVLERALAKN